MESGTNMSILAWLVVGVVAGWVANMVMNSGRGGLISDLLIGVLGALVGGFIMGLVTNTDYTTGINVPTLLVAIGGAIVLLVLYRVVTGQKVLRGR